MKLLLVALLLSVAPCCAQDPSPWIKAPGVSVKRPGGKILIWALPSAQARFGRTGLRKIVEAADADLSALGVSQRAVIYTGPVVTRGFADVLGKLVVLGSKAEVLAAARKTGVIDPDDAAWLEREWRPEARNPEKSDFSSSGRGRYTVIDADACGTFARTADGTLTPEQAAALFALHGVGHQAGMSHPRSQTFNDDAARILSMLTGRMFVGDGGAAVSLEKRKPEALFDAKRFAESDARDDLPNPGKQRAKWDAAFAAR